MEPSQSRLRTAALFATLMAVAAAHWAYVFGVPPRVPRTAADWPKEIRYYAVLEQAVFEARVPYYVSRPIQETRKFLAIPEVVVSPQIVLLPWLGVDSFLFVHVLLLSGATIGACLYLRREKELSVPTLLLLFLLLGFNGHITAHLAIGHSMWGGYFLLPVFLLLMLETDRSPGGLWPMAIGAALAVMLLQGSYHVFVWCVLFLLLQLPVGPGRSSILAALGWSVALGLVRLVPAAVILLGRRDPEFQTGYPGVIELVAGLTVIRDVSFPRLGGGSMGGLQWWEFDIYVGPVAAVWLVVFGIRGLLRRPDRTSLAVPASVLALWSSTACFERMARLDLPLLSTQRVSSRFLIVPLLLLILLAAIETERWRRAGSPARTIAVGLIAAATLVSLAAHTQAWTMARVEALSPPPPRERDLEITIVPPEADGPRDALYVASVRVSAVVSAAAFGLALWHWRRLSRGSSR